MPGESTEPSSTRLRGLKRAAGAILRLFRDAWLVVGLVVFILLLSEGLYIGQASLRRAVRSLGSSTPAANRRAEPHPYADSLWWPEFVREREALRYRWEPYSYARTRPFSGQHINIEESGLRRTPSPAQTLPMRDAAAVGRPRSRLRVFFFGGSTTWGFNDRDENTRPAAVARRLYEAGYDPEVVNFGQMGAVGAQELVTLLFELHSGNVPDAVVFWDGVNDVNATRRYNGVPGRSYSEDERAAGAQLMFDMQKRDGTVPPTLALRSLLHYSALYRRLREQVARPAAVVPQRDPASFCKTLMAYWVDQARVVDRLAEAYGFDAMVVWQPQWQTSRRPQSAFERAIKEGSTLYPQDRGIAAHHVECSRVADSLVAAGAARSIYNWAELHAADTGTVFLDEYSHTTERATAIEGDSVAAQLIRILAGNRAK